MHTEDVLTAVDTGVWWWTRSSQTVTLDAVAARLLTLDGEPVRHGMLTVGRAEVRARVHVVDFVEFESVLALALAESTVAESLLRVVGERRRGAAHPAGPDAAGAAGGGAGRARRGVLRGGRALRGAAAAAGRPGRAPPDVGRAPSPGLAALP